MADIQKVVTEAVFRDEMSAGMAAAAGAADKLNASIDRQEQTFRKAGPTAESLVKKLDAVTKAEAQLEAAAARAAREQATLQAGLTAGTVTSDQVARSVAGHSAEVARLEANLARARGAATTTATANVALAQTSQQAAYQMKQLALQAPDVVQGLLGGISPFQVLLQQGGQVVQVMGGVGNAVRAVGTMLMSAIASPGGAAVIATAVLAGFGYAAESAERRMIGLQNSLRATRDDYVALAATVNTTAKRLAATSNIGSGDAREAGTILAASPTFSGNGADLERNIKLARDLAAVMGTDLPQAATKLSAAMRDPGTEAQKLADGGFRSMSQALANSIKLQADAGDKAGAYARVIEAMGQTVGGAGEPQTALQNALGGLSEAFTKTGQDGKSLAESIGSVVVSAASAAVRAITDVVNAIERLRQAGVTVQQEVAARAGATSPSIAAQNPDTVGLPVLRGPAIPGRDERATGLFQVLPSTAREMGYRAEVLDQNILAGMTYLDRQTRATGSVEGGLARYGGYGNDTTAAQGYIGRVRGADLNRLPADVASQIEYWGQVLGMTPDMIALGQRLAVVESGGRHYAPSGTVAGGGIPSGAVVDGIGGVGMAEGGAYARAIQGRRDGRLLADQAFGASRGVLSQRIAENSAQQQLMERGIAQATAGGGDPEQQAATVTRLTQRLQELRGAATDLITEQQKLARSAQDSVAPLQAEEGATRDLAGIRQQFVDAARRSGTQVDEGAVAQAQAAKLQSLSVAYYDNVDALNRKADADARVLPLLEQGGRAAEYAVNREKALEEARKNTLPSTAARRVAEDALTAALNRGTDAQIDRQAAMDVSGFAKQQEYLETELSLLTATAEKRAEELAILQERQKLGLKLGEQATIEQQKALDAAAAVARIGTELQQQKAGLEALSSGFIQIFDRVGDAITDAFVQGSASAVKWGNVVKAIGTQVLSMFLRLGVMTPITNAVFGRNEGTLWSGLAAVAGGGGAKAGTGGGGGGSDLLSLGGLFGSGKSLLEGLGFTGAGSWGSGLSASIFGTAATPAVYGPAGEVITAASAANPGLLGSAGVGGFGSLAGGIGAGFGAGTLLNGLLGGNQDSGMVGAGLGATAATIAAMIPALMIPGIGPVLAGLLGGAAGGALGGMIGPKASVKGYGYALRGDDQGLLTMTDQFYNESGKASFEEAASAIAAMNDYLGRMGVTISGAIGVGGNKNGPDYSHANAGSYTEGVSKLWYGSKDSDLDYQIATKRGRQFADAGEMQKFVDGFYAAKAAVEALTKEPIPAFTQQMEAITSTFDAALAQAREYGMAEDKLTDARTKAVNELEAQRAATLRNTRDSLAIRRLAAAGNGLEADLARQSLDARTELAEFVKQLDTLALTAAERAGMIADLEQTQADERLAIIRQYGKDAANEMRQAQDEARQIGGSLRAYIDSLATGTAGGAAPIDRLYAAQSQYERDRVLATGGDRDALGRITQTADAMLTAARDVYASSEGFQTIKTYIGASLSNLPVVKGYDQMQAESLNAIQVALTNGTLNTSTVINPAGNLVTIAGGSLSLAGVESWLSTVNTTVGYVVDTVAATSTMERTVMGWVVDGIAAASVQDRTVMGWIVDTISATSVLDRTATGFVVDTLMAVSTTDATYQHQHSLYLAAANDNLAAGNIIAADAAVASTSSLAAMNTILADSSAASTASIAALNTIMVDASAAQVLSIISADTNAVAVGGAIVATVVDVNTSLSTIYGAVRDVNASLATIDASINRGGVADGSSAVLAALGVGHKIAVDGFAATVKAIGSADTNNVTVGNIGNTIGASINSTADQVRGRVIDVVGAVNIGFAAVNDNLMLFNRYIAANAWNTMLTAGAGGLAITADPSKPGSGRRYDGTNVVPFALGGLPDMVGGPTMAPMALFGEAGPEAIMPLGRMADGTLGVYSIPTSGADAAQMAEVIAALERLERALRQVGAVQALEVRDAGAATVEAVARLNTTIERKAAVR